MAQPNKKSSTRADSVAEQIKARARQRRERIHDVADSPCGARRRNDMSPHLELVDWQVGQLSLPKRNVRRADTAQVQRVAESLRTFGVCRPLLVSDEGEVVEGVVTLKAAVEVGLATIPCIVVSHLGAEELRLLRVTLNRLGETGGWDFEALQLEFQELVLLDAPLEIGGFSEQQIDQILQDDEPDADERGPLAPADQELAVTAMDDLWIVGVHRLLCGNSLDNRSYRQIFDHQAAQLILTDPPYNVPIKGHVSSKDHREFAMASGEMSDEQFLEFNLTWISCVLEYVTEGALLMPFIDWRGLPSITEAALANGLRQINLVAWVKSNAGMGSLWRSQHELLPVFKWGDLEHINNVALGRHGRHRSNVWRYPGASSFGSDARAGLKLHPTVKPTAMLEDALLDVTRRRDVVLDPFAGSGSTLIAAEATGRICRAVELDPRYCDVVLARWSAIGGEAPRLAATGETFEEVRSRRMDAAGRMLALPAPDHNLPNADGR